jgi:chemotaxis protein CheX
MDTAYIRPFVTATSNVFATMLDCQLEQETVSDDPTRITSHGVTGTIGLSGGLRGNVVLSLTETAALDVTERMLGQRPDSVDSEVVDAIGELTNMIAGSAKSELPENDVCLGLPSVIAGDGYRVFLGHDVEQFRIDFKTPWGPLSLQVAFRTSQPAGREAKQQLQTTGSC